MTIVLENVLKEVLIYHEDSLTVPDYMSQTIWMINRRVIII